MATVRVSQGENKRGTERRRGKGGIYRAERRRPLAVSCLADSE